MADFSVPIATGVFPQAPDIANAKGTDLSWIGNLPDLYWAGLNQQYQQRNRDLFKNGIPSTFQGMGTALLQAAGASGIPPLGRRTFSPERRRATNMGCFLRQKSRATKAAMTIKTITNGPGAASHKDEINAAIIARNIMAEMSNMKGIAMTRGAALISLGPWPRRACYVGMYSTGGCRA